MSQIIIKFVGSYTGKSASMRCKMSIVGLCSEYLAASKAARKNIQVAGEAGYTP